MNNVAKGIVCGVAGVASAGSFLGIISSYEVNMAKVAECAPHLSQANYDTDALDVVCYQSGAMSVFETKESTYSVVSNPGEEPYNMTPSKLAPLSPDEFTHRAYELKQSQETEFLLLKLAAIASGFAVSGLLYKEWKAETPVGEQN